MKLRCLFCQGAGGQTHLRSDGPSQEASVFRHEIEGGGCTEIQHQDRAAVERVGGDAIGDSIGAHGMRGFDIQCDGRSGSRQEADLAGNE